jgi:predicted Fe-Mo cluster-binding NifX family protein
MNIAIPVKTNKENPAVSPLFGKAKWFAFVDTNNNQITIHKNNCNGGAEVIKWFVQNGIDTIIFQEMGITPYNLIKQVGNINLFHSGYERILLQDLIEKFNNSQLTLVDENNIQETIAKHEKKHPHSHSYSHSHHH